MIHVILLLIALCATVPSALALKALSGAVSTPFARYALDTSYLDSYALTSSIGGFYSMSGGASESTRGYGLQVSWPGYGFSQYSQTMWFTLLRVNTTSPMPLVSSSNGQALYITPSLQLVYVTPDQKSLVVTQGSNNLLLGYTYHVLITVDEVYHSACVYYYEYSPLGLLTNYMVLPVIQCIPTVSKQPLRDSSYGFNQVQTYLWDLIIFNSTLTTYQSQYVYSDTSIYTQAPISGVQPTATPAPTVIIPTTLITPAPTTSTGVTPPVGCPTTCVACSQRNTTYICSGCTGNWAMPGCTACNAGFTGSQCQYFTQPIVASPVPYSRLRLANSVTDDYSNTAATSGSYVFGDVPFAGGIQTTIGLISGKVYIQYKTLLTNPTLSFWFRNVAVATTSFSLIDVGTVNEYSTYPAVTTTGTSISWTVGTSGVAVSHSITPGYTYHVSLTFDSSSTQCMYLQEFDTMGFSVNSYTSCTVNSAVASTRWTYISGSVSGTAALWDILVYNQVLSSAAAAAIYNSASLYAKSPCLAATLPNGCLGCKSVNTVNFTCSACSGNYNVSSGCTLCDDGWGGPSCQTFLYFANTTGIFTTTYPPYTPPTGFKARCNPVIPSVTQISWAVQPIYGHYDPSTGCVGCLPGFGGTYCHQCLKGSVCPWGAYYGYSNYGFPAAPATIILYQTQANITCPTVLALPTPSPVSIFYDPATNCMECLTGFNGPFCTDNSYPNDYRQSLYQPGALRASSLKAAIPIASSCLGNYNPATNCTTCNAGYTGFQCQQVASSGVTTTGNSSLVLQQQGGTVKTVIISYPVQNTSCAFGYTGYNCGVPNFGFSPTSVFNPCLNGGRVYSTDNIHIQCDCTGTGFTGTNCAYAFNPCDQSKVANPCKNNGICQFLNNQQVCICPAEVWTGDDCSIPVNMCDVDQVQQVTCANGGQCTYLNPGQYNCTCAYGWEGVNCDIPINACTRYPGICNTYDKTAPCTSTGAGTYNCGCTTNSGFYGANCSLPADPCSVSSPLPYPCLNGGGCSHSGPNGNYSCTCPSGFVGKNCQTLVDYCSKTDVNNPYKVYPQGSACGINPTTKNYITGTIYSASSFQCYSATSFPQVVGDYMCCNSSISNVPTYVNGALQCGCPNGLSGKNCNTLVNYCSAPLNPPYYNPCYTNGTNPATTSVYTNGCQNNYASSSFTCACKGGWTGAACSSFTDYCNTTSTTSLKCPANVYSNSCTCQSFETCKAYPGGIACCSASGCNVKPLF